MSFRHPGNVALGRWLAGGSDNDVERHVDSCQRCASVLEDLDESAGLEIGDALAQALAPPDDLTERLVAGVNARLSSRQVMGVVADLFGAGIETTRLLLIEDTDDND
jgi:hypothetical protein